jgi:hypothetical protein
MTTRSVKPLKLSGHYMYRSVVTIFTAQWSLFVPHSGHYMYRQWSLYVPHSGHYMCRTVFTIFTAQWSLFVPHSGHYMYRQRSLYVPYSGHYMCRTVFTIFTAQWSLFVPHSGHYMYRQFNIQQFSVLPTQCVYVFCVDLRTNSDYYSIPYNVRKRVPRAEVTSVSVCLSLLLGSSFGAQNTGQFSFQVNTGDFHCIRTWPMCVTLTHSLVCAKSRGRNVLRRSPNPDDTLPTLHLNIH